MDTVEINVLHLLMFKYDSFADVKYIIKSGLYTDV
jgi:hypothetical protein